MIAGSIKLALFISLLLVSLLSFSQPYDLLLKNGHVIDPKNEIDAVQDVAISDGKIARVAASIPESDAQKVINAEGLYVTPGLIDMHAHLFFGTEENRYLRNSYTALPPDGFTFRAGVTTAVDVGGPGWRNFDVFKKQTVDHSKTRVLAFINIVGEGMSGGHFEQNLQDMDPKMASMVITNNRTVLVGVKVAHYSGPEWLPVQSAVKAGKLAGVPVMVDFGGYQPELSLERLLMQELRPGDILTHTFAHVPGRIPIVDEQGKVRDYVWEAQKRGVVFDVGHGGGSFVWSQALPANGAGFKANSISTDLHTGSMNGGMKDMSNVMSKFLNLGYTIQEVIEKSTHAPATYIQRSDLGHLSEGAEADVAVFRIQEGEFGFIDTRGIKMAGDQKLVCELTLRAGQVVWDLNGISCPEVKITRK